jgi:hypothetical protein
MPLPVVTALVVFGGCKVVNKFSELGFGDTVFSTDDVGGLEADEAGTDGFAIVNIDAHCFNATIEAFGDVGEGMENIVGVNGGACIDDMGGDAGDLCGDDRFDFGFIELEDQHLDRSFWA